MKFKVGDTIVCKNNKNFDGCNFGNLVVGKEYTILRIKYSSSTKMTLYKVDKTNWIFYETLFYTNVELRKMKLDKLNER